MLEYPIHMTTENNEANEDLQTPLEGTNEIVNTKDQIQYDKYLDRHVIHINDYDRLNIDKDRHVIHINDYDRLNIDKDNVIPHELLTRNEKENEIQTIDLTNTSQESEPPFEILSKNSYADDLHTKGYSNDSAKTREFHSESVPHQTSCDVQKVTIEDTNVVTSSSMALCTTITTKSTSHTETYTNLPTKRVPKEIVLDNFESLYKNIKNQLSDQIKKENDPEMSLRVHMDIDLSRVSGELVVKSKGILFLETKNPKRKYDQIE